VLAFLLIIVQTISRAALCDLWPGVFRLAVLEPAAGFPKVPQSACVPPPAPPPQTPAWVRLVRGTLMTVAQSATFRVTEPVLHVLRCKSVTAEKTAGPATSLGMTVGELFRQAQTAELCSVLSYMGWTSSVDIQTETVPHAA